MFDFISARDKKLRWTILHPDHWTKNEVQDWLKCVLEKNKITGNDKYAILEAFDDVDGHQLIKMSAANFKDLDMEYGELLFKTFKGLLPSHDQQFTEPSPDSCEESAGTSSKFASGSSQKPHT
ncbi:hypothetical protein SNE40_003243 [Patella caerulea]|uniref:PNT domain-containing protein n=1 Tax=Patella caerulea TaxID=87958 RepID=A0AAN8K7G2_PATCE